MLDLLQDYDFTEAIIAYYPIEQNLKLTNTNVELFQDLFSYRRLVE